MEKIITITNYDRIRTRINNYITIIQICLQNFNRDNLLFLAENERIYLGKISKGISELFLLLQELDCLILDKRMTTKLVDKLRHDLRSAINIIQGYSELIKENIINNHESLMGGNFLIIISASQEILKNSDQLKAQ